MGKIDKEQKARMDGMAYALKIATEKGIDGLENEIKARGILGVNLTVDSKTLRESYESMCTTLFQNMKTVFLQVLIKELGFGEKRLKKINKAYEEKTMELFEFDPYGEHYVTFEDMARELKEKYHMDIEVETVKENQESFDERKDRRILPNIIKLLEHENQHEAADVLREHLHEAVAVW